MLEPVPAMSAARGLLERYVEAKDRVRPHLMDEIYARDAVLTYSIATDTITFPAKVVGSKGIAQTLVIDFAARFSGCKTFYVCESAPAANVGSVLIPWLVLMKECASSCLRIGKGFYRWTFVQQGTDLCVAAMHIHIERMDPIADEGGRLLDKAQSVLTYPWLRPAVLRSQFEALAQADAAFVFLDDFKAPLALDG